MSTPARSRAFELRVLPLGEGAYALGLFQSPAGPAANGDLECVARLQGDPLRTVIEPVLSALKRAGYRPTDLRPARREPFRLAEMDGVRLGLLFLALRPLRKPSRMEAVVERIRTMADEELYYWYSKSTAPREGRRAQRALRTLVAEE
ncbi:hypothetical protein BH23GEM7_BH23GEM7_14230 [soil metagenome]|nr:hypothetical protein [Gemmatimonadota bacterium]